MRITKDNINAYIKGKSMYCYNNEITHIDFIPEGITDIECWGNKLTKLPKLPESLIRLHCHSNRLTELPKLPESLIGLFCHNNNLPYKVTLNNLKQHNKLTKRKQILSRICV